MIEGCCCGGICPVMTCLVEIVSSLIQIESSSIELVSRLILIRELSRSIKELSNYTPAKFGVIFIRIDLSVCLFALSPN